VGFVYGEVRMRTRKGRPEWIEIKLEPHAGMRGSLF